MKYSPFIMCNPARAYSYANPMLLLPNSTYMSRSNMMVMQDLTPSGLRLGRMPAISLSVTNKPLSRIGRRKLV